MFYRRKLRSKSSRGLGAGPDEHRNLALKHLEAAMRPRSFGCRVAIESLGAARAEMHHARDGMDSILTGDFRRASMAIDKECLVKPSNGLSGLFGARGAKKRSRR
jgi:hypothetical protein